MAKKTLDASSDRIPYHSKYLAKLC